MEQTFASKPQPGEPWDVVIIGSGPAALTAAIYTTRGAISTLILGGSSWGGQLMLTTEVDNFPGFPEGIQGPDLMLNMRKQAERFGAEFVQADCEKVDMSKKPFEIHANGTLYYAKAIIIGTGASILWLDAPGVKEFIGKGVSSCAPCDAPFFKGKRVAVVGGGDSAMEEALVLTKYASEVTIIHRRDAFRASKAMQEKVLSNKNIKVLWNSEVQKAEGGNVLESVTVINNKTNQVSTLSVDGLFIAIGHKPESALFSGQIQLNEKGNVKKDPNSPFTTSTNVPGVFVAGDVEDYIYKQAITAAGEGCKAAMDVLKYLSGI